MDIIQLISAAGIGSIVGSLLTACVQAWLSNRQQLNNRNFQEKKEAFLGLLNAYHQAAIKPSDTASKEFAFWQMRCELVASAKVRKAIQEIVDTNHSQEKRLIAHENMKAAMRHNLQIQSF